MFINMDQSQRLKDAQKMVSQHLALLTTIKKEYQKRQILEYEVQKRDTCLKLAFNIQTREYVDDKAMPEDVKAPYIDQKEVWYKQIEIRRGENFDAIKIESDMEDSEIL